ncbi:MAG: hypothetical protein ACI4N4_01580 [Candidatus Fimenecus sp.]
MKLLIPAIIMFVVGIILAVITAVKYSKAKRKADDEGAEFNNMSYVIRIAVVFALFVAAQILLFLNR